MGTLYVKVAGLDVHQKFITVGVRRRLGAAVTGSLVDFSGDCGGWARR